MGFLIRCAFWLSLVLLLIPLDTGDGAVKPDPVGPLQALAAVRDAARDVAGLCERQPEVCATAEAAMHTITARAREGVRIAQDMMQNEMPAQTETATAPQSAEVASTGSIAAAE